MQLFVKDGTVAVQVEVLLVQVPEGTGMFRRAIVGEPGVLIISIVVKIAHKSRRYFAHTLAPDKFFEVSAVELKKAEGSGRLYGGVTLHHGWHFSLAATVGIAVVAGYETESQNEK